MTNNVQVSEQDTPRQLTLFDLEQLETRIKAGLRSQQQSRQPARRPTRRLREQR